MSYENTNITPFDLNDIVQIQVPIDGKMEYIERIRSASNPNLILWQVKRSNITFRDNIPVKLSYDINPSTSFMFYEPNEQDLYLIPVGNIVRHDNILKSFSRTSYAHTPIYIEITKNNSFEIFFKIKTNDKISTRQNIFGMKKLDHFALEFLNGKLHWELNNKYGKTKILPNTIYFIRFVKNADKIQVYLSLDGNNFELEIDTKLTSTVANQYLYVGIDTTSNGIHPFLGEIFLNQSYIIYNNIKYHLKITNDEMLLIRDGSITVSNQIISGFSNKNYAHTPIFVNWSFENETTIGLKITTGSDVNSRQELFGMQTSDNFELEILNGRLHWELTDIYSPKTLAINTNYFVEFKKVKKECFIKIYTYNANNDKLLYDEFKSTVLRECSNQYLYLGIDVAHGGTGGIEQFKGKIHCPGSYLIYNDKQYNFRI